MKSYQELIEERKKELMRGAATSTASAPKALSVAEAIEKRKQELAKDVTTSVPTAAASDPSGVLDTSQPAQDDGLLFGRKPLGFLGALSKVVGGTEEAVDAFGAINPGATARSALGATQQALGTAIQAPAEQVSQALGPLQLLMEAAAGKPWAIEKLQEAETQADVIRAGLETDTPASRIASVGKGIAESGATLVEEQAPKMLKRPENLLTPEGIAWAVQTGAQSLGPMAIGALSSRFGGKAAVAPFVPAGAAEEYARVRDAGGMPSDALGQALPRGGLEVAFESPVMKAAGAGRAVKAMLLDTAGETATEGGNIGLDVASGMAPTQEEARSRLAGAALVGPVTGAAQTALSAPLAALQQSIQPPAAKGATLAREKLQTAGAYAEGAAKTPAGGQNEGGATTPPAPAQKAPVAPPVKPQGQVSREASVAAGQRILNDLKTDPTLGVPEADRPRVLHERTKVYEAQEQAKLDGPKEASKTLKLVRDIGKTVRTEPNILAGVEAPTNRILTNVTKGIAPLSATELAVRKLASEGRAPIIQQTGQPLQNTVPVPVPTTTKAQDQKAALGIVRRIGKEANATPALPVGLEASTNQIVSGITKGIEPLSTTEQFVRKMVRDAPAPRAPAPPAPFDPANARFPEQPSSVEPTASMPQRIRVGGRFAPKGVVGTASTQPRGNITQGVPIVQRATLGEASTTIGATKASKALEPIRVTQPEQQSQEPKLAPLPTAQTAKTIDAFGAAIGAARPYKGRLAGRVNKPAAKAVSAGDTRGVLTALAGSRNVIVRKIAELFGGTSTKFAIDETAQETFDKTSSVQSANAEYYTELFRALDNARAQQSRMTGFGADTLYLHDLEGKAIELPTKGKSARDVLEAHLADNPGLEDYLRRVGTSTVTSVPVAGKYDPQTDTIKVASEYDAQDESTIAHEIVHAQAHKAISNPSARQKPYVDRLNILLGKVRTAWDGTEWAKEYGLKDAHEFLSEGMSNPRFQQRLSTVKVEKATAWEKFTEYVAGLVGLSNDNAFVELMDVYQGLVTEQQSQQGEMTDGMQGQEEGRRDSSNQEVTDNAPVGTGQATGSMRGATNARAAMLRVGGSIEPGVNSELRRTANELKNSPNTQDTKVVVMTAEEAVAEGSPLRKVDADGTVTAGKAAYGRNGDTIYLQEDATTEDVVHETAHAATVKAIAAVEQGVVSDPESTLALENLKAAVNRLGEITAADLPGVPADIVARIQYAARNPQEAVAVLRSSPETAKALRDSKIMVDVKADRKTKIPVKMPILKAIINSIASIVGKQVFKTQHRDQVVRTIERMLLADSVIQSSKALERTDVRGIKMSDVKAGDTASRLTGTDAKRGVAPTKTDNAPPSPTLPKALKDIPRGLPGLVDKILPKIQRLVSYKMGASPTVYSMVRDTIGGRNLKDWQTENLLSETRDSMRKGLGKRADMYNDELVKALKGQPNTLPAEAKAAVASTRLLIDGLTIKAMALGAMSPSNIVSAIKRIGSYVHDDYKAWKMGPGEWQSLQESPRGDGSNNAADLIMSVLPKMMQDIALPADAQLDALGTLAQGKGKAAKKRAQAELDVMLGRYGFTEVGATVDQQVAFLKKVRDSFTPDSFREHAAELARKLMNPKGIVLDESMPFKPFSVDATGLKNKTKVPEWQKELWGKYEEYDAIVINTVRMLGGIVDKFASLEGYKQQLIDEGTIVQNKVPHGYTVLKDNDPLVYGPLNGYAIRDRDVALVGALAKQGVQGASAFLQGLTIGGAFGDALSKASSLSKIQAIVLAPDAWLFNATSTVMVGTLASGHPLAIAQHGIKAADFASREAFAGMGRTTKAVETDIQKVFEILFKRGVMGDSALAQDLRSDLAERVIDEAYKNAPATKRMWHNVKSGAQSGVDFGGRALSFGDTAGKVLSVYVRVPYLRNIYPNKTWDEILTIAADETADSLPSMSRSIPILKAMGRQGVVMPFAGYFAETFRNTAADLGLGFKYQLMGLKALSEGNAKEGTAAALYGTMIHAGNIARHGIVWAVRSGIAASIYGMYQLALTAFGDDDEEPDDEAKKISAQVESARAIMEDPEKYKAFREMVPDDVMGDVVPLRELEPGVFSYTTTQRLDMYTTGSALTALERGGWDNKDAWQDAGVAMLSPFNQFSLVAKPVVDLLKGREGAEWDLAASLLIPAPVKRADRITKAAEKGYEMTPFEKSMHMGGMTISFVDVKQELASKMQGLASDVNDKMRAVTDSLDPNRKDVTERYTSTNKFSEEFSHAILAQAQMFKEFAPVIERAKGFGLSTQDIVAAAKLNGVSLSDTDLIGILDGKFTPTSAAKVITQKWQTELKAASQNPRQSARINAYYKAALEDAKKVDEAALIMLKSEGMNVRGQQG